VEMRCRRVVKQGGRVVDVDGAAPGSLDRASRQPWKALTVSNHPDQPSGAQSSDAQNGPGALRVSGLQPLLDRVHNQVEPFEHHDARSVEFLHGFAPRVSLTTASIHPPASWLSMFWATNRAQK
jgi:hypothetical protein